MGNTRLDDQVGTGRQETALLLTAGVVFSVNGIWPEAFQLLTTFNVQVVLAQ
jgi:hypothetical protein